MLWLKPLRADMVHEAQACDFVRRQRILTINYLYGLSLGLYIKYTFAMNIYITM